MELSNCHKQFLSQTYFTLVYVDELRDLVFNMNEGERDAILKRYENKTPAFLNTQFAEKRSKAEAVENYKKRKQQEMTLFPPGKLSEETDIFNHLLKLFKKKLELF